MSDGMTDRRSQPDEERGQYIGLGSANQQKNPPLVSRHILPLADIELLHMIAEEAGEVVQAVMKILRHGWESYNPTLPPAQRIPNRQHLEQELSELNALVHAMRLAGMVNMDFARINSGDMDRIALRKMQYTHHQRGELKGILRMRTDDLRSFNTEKINDR